MRLVVYELVDGGVVIYDPENRADAWLEFSGPALNPEHCT